MLLNTRGNGREGGGGNWDVLAGFLLVKKSWYVKGL